MDMKKDVGRQHLYELTLSEGWNLISFPGTPVKPAVSDVFGSARAVDMVHGFRNGEWLIANRTSESWKGNLTEITGGYGYWVHAETAETLSTPISRPSSEHPALSMIVGYGWNLIGVLDSGLSPAGAAPANGSGDPDGYFANLDWDVAYSLEGADPEGFGIWKKALPGQGARGFVRNGRGYWVWVDSAGTFTPYGDSKAATAGVAS